ncbi:MULTISPECIES: YciK family oxidoreductase [Pseudomonadaceae]|uniref:NAD(P)-dependent dehydrogenase (Short-subunit alcohol dehydrogenase family) n=1 Tax=Ectopseudomonas oleovorans TaxID=301 RepID=A0A3D9EFR9_ECTOL|nr:MULTISPECIES: YciK family oxidoreductase [Pseudomonas]RED01862.1 NAD(P)-dependent dehydrogenase (short-subunit alcohol dehydrogenase family) [Pseudomonas oleovorans]
MFDYQAPAELLKDRIILVTGANRGIGAALAKGCAALGASVILQGRDAAALDQVCQEILASGGQVETLVLDLEQADAAAYAAVAERLRQRHGRLDGLVHNAGLLGPRVLLEETPAAALAQVLQVNVQAGFALTQALLPLLRAAGEASLIFTSSSVGRKGRGGWGAYSVSKFATEGLMQVWAEELAEDGIRVNSVNPGGTRTAMRAAAYPEEDPARVPAAEAILPVYLYLLGPASRGTTGQALNAQ